MKTKAKDKGSMVGVPFSLQGSRVKKIPEGGFIENGGCHKEKSGKCIAALGGV